jgi:hypothetical protein
MAEIHSKYGPERSMGSRASNGGQIQKKDLPYSPPVGPQHQMVAKPGLSGGTNHGCCGTQHKGK